MWGTPASPPPAQGQAWGGMHTWETLIAHDGIMGLVSKHPDEHASPLGRAHIAPGQPWARLAAIDPSDLQGARGRGSWLSFVVSLGPGLRFQIEQHLMWATASCSWWTILCLCECFGNLPFSWNKSWESRCVIWKWHGNLHYCLQLYGACDQEPADTCLALRSSPYRAG